jgi:hypothetical protein
MLSSIALFLATRLGRYVFAGGVLVALVVSFAAHQRKIGSDNALKTVQETTGIVVNKGRVAGNKSLSGSGGVQLQFRD